MAAGSPHTESPVHHDASEHSPSPVLGHSPSPVSGHAHHHMVMDDLLGLLRIRIKRGLNLAVRDVRSSDPYVVVRMGHQVLNILLHSIHSFILLICILMCMCYI